jgi:hypothetical protein
VTDPVHPCQFILIPAGGLPARLVPEHPYPAAVSDAIGGAFPVPVYLSPNCAYWVRESCATEGLDRNVLATTLGNVVSGKTLPILGPAVLTTITWHHHLSPTGAAVGAGTGLGQVAAEGFMNILSDLHHALTGHSDGFIGEGLDESWADNVRRIGEAGLAAPIPDGWPYQNSPIATQPRDPVWSGLARTRGGAVTYVPLPLAGR